MKNHLNFLRRKSLTRLLAFIVILISGCNKDDTQVVLNSTEQNYQSMLDSSQAALKKLKREHKDNTKNIENRLRRDNCNAYNGFYAFHVGKNTYDLYWHFIDKIDNDLGEWYCHNLVENSGNVVEPSTQVVDAAYFKGQVLVFYKDNNLKIKYSKRIQDYSDSNWPWLINQNTINRSNIKHFESAVLNDELYLFYQLNDNKLYVSKTSDLINWSETYINVIQENSALTLGFSASSAFGKIYIFYNENSRLKYRTLQSNGSLSSAYDIGGMRYFLSSTFYKSENKLYLFSGPSYSFVEYRVIDINNNGISSSWERVNTNDYTRSKLSFFTTENYLYYFHSGVNTDAIYYHRKSKNSQTWQGSYKIGDGYGTVGAVSSAEIFEYENLALNATATASSTYPSSLYDPYHINDNNIHHNVYEDHWTNVYPGLPAWIRLDFGSTKSFNQIVVHTPQTYEISDYKIQYYSGGVWQTLSEVNNNSSTIRTHNFSLINSRYVRVLVEKGPSFQSGYARLTEVEIYNK